MRLRREKIEIKKFDELVTRNIKSGVYLIRCVENGKRYIGESLNIDKRWTWHISDLNKNTHHSKTLQADWNRFGAESFVFEIIELYDSAFLKTRSKLTAALLIRERVWQNRYDTINNGYNGIDSVDNIIFSNGKCVVDKKHLSWYVNNHTYENSYPIGTGINPEYSLECDKGCKHPDTPVQSFPTPT